VFREFSETYNVSRPAVDIVYVAASGGLTIALRTPPPGSRRFQDLVMGTATANGNAGKTAPRRFLPCQSGTEHFNGRIPTSSANAGLHRRVENTAPSTGTPLNAPSRCRPSGDTANLQPAGRGFAVEQRPRDQQRQTAYPTGTISVVATITARSMLAPRSPCPTP
jgi:hypothetical protein